MWTRTRFAGPARWLPLAVAAMALAALGVLLPARLGRAAQKEGGKLKFEIYEDAKKEYRWRLKAANGEILATSSEGYKTKASAEHAIDLITKGAKNARVEELP
jgi:uncharacterized protein